MRRTLALLGAAALAVTGLAGPASASDIGVTQITAEFSNSTGVNSTGVNPDVTSPHDQAWYDLQDSTTESLVDHTVVGCVGTISEEPIEFVTYEPADIIESGVIFKTADPGFSGSSDRAWTDPEVLDSLRFDLRLVFDYGGINQDVMDVTNNNPAAGAPNSVCVGKLPS